MAIIGIIGAGEQGAALARRLVDAGHSVRIANSRRPRTLEDVAQRTGAVPVELADVASGADFLFLVLPLGEVARLPRDLTAGLADGGAVVDVCNYVPVRDGPIAEILAGLPETAWVAAHVHAPVVKALNNITYGSLVRGSRSGGPAGRIALPVAADDPAKRAAVMALIRQIGFDAYDAGTLADSWRQQIGQPAYCTDPTLDELPRLLARADPSSVARNREQAMRMMVRIPPDFSKADLTAAARFMAGLDRTRPGAWAAVLRLGWAMLRFGSGGGSGPSR